MSVLNGSLTSPHIRYYHKITAALYEEMAVLLGVEREVVDSLSTAHGAGEIQLLSR